MPEPLLHLGDIGLMVERVGGGRGTQRVRAKPLAVPSSIYRAVRQIAGEDVLAITALDKTMLVLANCAIYLTQASPPVLCI
jgi:hypothetical protein